MAKRSNKGFRLFFDCIDSALKILTDEKDLGTLFKYIINMYKTDDVVEPNDRLINAAFQLFKNAYLRDKEYRAQQAEHGAKGGNPAFVSGRSNPYISTLDKATLIENKATLANDNPNNNTTNNNINNTTSTTTLENVGGEENLLIDNLFEVYRNAVKEIESYDIKFISEEDRDTFENYITTNNEDDKQTIIKSLNEYKEKVETGRSEECHAIIQGLLVGSTGHPQFSSSGEWEQLGQSNAVRLPYTTEGWALLKDWQHYIDCKELPLNDVRKIEDMFNNAGTGRKHILREIISKDWFGDPMIRNPMALITSKFKNLKETF